MLQSNFPDAGFRLSGSIDVHTLETIVEHEEYPASPLLDARAAHSTYVIFGMIFGLLFAGSFVFREASAKLICGAAFALVLVWIRSYRLIFDGREIVYSTLLSRRRSIAMDSIANVRTEIGGGSPFDPMYRLVLTGSNDCALAPIIINMKIFKRDDLQKLFVILGPKMVGHPRLEIFKGRKPAR